MAYCHAYSFFGGVAKVTVPDNPKTAVIQDCRYEPLLHTSCQKMAAHYGAVIISAHPRRPRDKGKIERRHDCWQKRLDPSWPPRTLRNWSGPILCSTSSGPTQTCTKSTANSPKHPSPPTSQPPPKSDASCGLIPTVRGGPTSGATQPASASAPNLIPLTLRPDGDIYHLRQAPDKHAKSLVLLHGPVF